VCLKYRQFDALNPPPETNWARHRTDKTTLCAYCSPWGINQATSGGFAPTETAGFPRYQFTS
jgi:hypothetical protein